MKIQINDHRKIFALQEEFNKLFPNLKIEFLGKPSNAGEAASKEIVKTSKRLGDCRVVHTKGQLTLLHSMTIADLQETLRDNYGLSVLILRKSGTHWIETTEDGNFSLEEQDKRAVSAA